MKICHGYTVGKRTLIYSICIAAPDRNCRDILRIAENISPNTLNCTKASAKMNVMSCKLLFCAQTAQWLALLSWIFISFMPSLYLLLDPHSIVPAPYHRVQDVLHGVDQPLCIPLDLFHRFISLCQLPVSFALDLHAQLKLPWLIKGLGI